MQHRPSPGGSRRARTAALGSRNGERFLWFTAPSSGCDDRHRYHPLRRKPGRRRRALYAALFALSTQTPLRAHSAWPDDPYDLVLTFTAVLLPVVIAVTWVRFQRHAGPAPSPPSALRLMHRGLGSALAGLGAAEAACWWGLAAHDNRAGWDGATVGIVALLGLTTLVTAAAVAAAARARRRLPPAPAASGPDGFDDLAALLRRWGAPPTAPAVIESMAVPLRAHRAAVLVGLIAGAAIAAPAWHALQEGPWARASAAAVFGAGIAAFVGVTVAVAVWWLRLLRKP